MYAYSYGIDTAYILVLLAIVFSLWASWKVKRTYKKYSDDLNARRITGAQAAHSVLNSRGLSNIPLMCTAGTMTDYYDPSSNKVFLSESTFNSASPVAVGVACHECGHAIQYAEGYWPAKLRMKIVPATNFGSKLSWPLIIAGLLLSSLIPVLWNLVYIGIGLFSLCVFFQLVTLPTEFNASSRALECIREQNLLEGEDYDKAKEVLTAAALTYVAALAVSLTQLLRMIAIYGRRRN